MKKVFITYCLFVLSTAVFGQDLLNHVHTGYQGWFTAKGDKSGTNRWVHWGSGDRELSPESITIDYFPDLREYDEKLLYKTPFTYSNGDVVKLFSSNDYETVDLHFKWMKEYGIDGVFLQRFLAPLKNPSLKKHRDKVLENVIKAAEKYNRKFAIMYDLSGYERTEKKSGAADFKEFINNDWIALNKKYNLTKLSSYMYEDQKPVLVMWGLGFKSRPFSVRYAKDVLKLFKGNDDSCCHDTYLVAGVPSYWRTLGKDSESNPIWNELYGSFDMITPWSVGRYNDENSYMNYLRNVTAPDIVKKSKLKIDYMPVVFPGFSWGNLKDEEFNKIPRNGGQFLWKQITEAKKSGADCIYFAMFDEVDEGTAIFKVAENQSQVPVQGTYVTLDADEYNLPSDWYLKIVEKAGEIFRNEKELVEDFPFQILGINSSSNK